MFHIRVHLTPCLVLVGAIGFASAPAQAQSPEHAGYVRISDSQPSEPVPVMDAPCNDPSGVSCPPAEYDGWYGYDDGFGYGHGCRHRFGYGACHSLCYRLCHGNGYRFYPPVKRPIYRTPVSYQKGFPDSWNGIQSNRPAYRAPTVYMPTDTTQLGYYYQAVPYWQPRAGMIPPPPSPGAWHTTINQISWNQHHPAGFLYGYAPTVMPSGIPSGVEIPGGSDTPNAGEGPGGDQLDGHGVPPAPCPSPVEATDGTEPVTNLEQATTSPSLLPIN